jgi:nucleoid DNA-binding protein
MNLTKIIEETGRRMRAGKMPSEKLTNADVKEVLETAIEVMKQALIEEERIEIQGFAVIEVKRTAIRNPKTLTTLDGEMRQLPAERIRWIIRPNATLRGQAKRRSRS